MLRGLNWARWLLLVWIAYHVLISAFHSLPQLIMHGFLLVVVAYLLFRPTVSAYFRAVGAQCFEANHGQTEEQVKFLARGSGYSLFLTSTEAVFSLQTRGGADTQTWEPKAAITERHKKQNRQTSRRHSLGVSPSVLRLQLIGAHTKPEVTGLQKQAGHSNYFIGRERLHWRTNVAHYGKVKYEQVYRGIDMVYYGLMSADHQLSKFSGWEGWLAPAVSPKFTFIG